MFRKESQADQQQAHLLVQASQDLKVNKGLKDYLERMVRLAEKVKFSLVF